jgi:hypothetical protein
MSSQSGGEGHAHGTTALVALTAGISMAFVCPQLHLIGRRCGSMAARGARGDGGCFHIVVRPRGEFVEFRNHDIE